MNLVPLLRGGQLPATSERGIEAVKRIEQQLRDLPQIDVQTRHFLHAGLYTRTMQMPAGAVVTGALIKIPTVLVISGHCTVLMGDGVEVEVNGAGVLTAAAGRKQAYLAHGRTWLAMSFATNARTVAEAEEEFTDEADQLLSRRDPTGD
jgi:hypothetical protein